MSVLTLLPTEDLRPRSAAQLVRFAAGDFLVLFAILAVVNYLAAPGDVGWFAVNPTPYLIIPVLLAVRYGFSAGVAGGLLTILFVIVGRHVVSHGVSLMEHRFTLITHPLLGALVGQVAEGLRKRAALAEGDNLRLDEENSRLYAERELMLLSRQDLQQRLGLFGADSVSLDEELEELSETSREFAPAQLLSSLERIARVRTAALYLVPEGSTAVPLTRVTSIGDSSKFPEFLYRADHQIVRESLEGGSFLIQKTILEATPRRTTGYLGAYPIVAVENRTTFLLVVQDLPFNDIRASTFEVIKSICDWMRFALAPTLHREARHRAVNQCEFYRGIEVAVATHKQQAIASTLVRVPFEIPEEVDPAPAFRELLKALPRKTVLSNSNEQGQRSLLFLLPAVSDPGTLAKVRDLFLDFGGKFALGDRFEPIFFSTNPGENPQQMWGRLVAVGQDLASQ